MRKVATPLVVLATLLSQAGGTVAAAHVGGTAARNMVSNETMVVTHPRGLVPQLVEIEKDLQASSS